MGLKILHCFDHYLPPTEIWAYNLISRIPEIENHIAAKIYLENKGLTTQFQQFKASTAKLEKELRTLAWKKDPVKKLKLKTQQRFSPKYVSELKAYVNQQKIDLVHAHFGNVGWSIMDLVKDNNLPLVVSFYGYDYSYLPLSDPQWKARYREMFKASALFLTEGIMGKEALIELGCPAEKIQIQRLGIHLQKFQERPVQKMPKELRLVQMASFTEKKGQIASIKAFAKAIKNCPGLSLDLIGDPRDPKYFKEVKNLIATLELVDQIKIKHFVAYNNLAEVLRSYQVFIHPSCYAANHDCEGGAPTIMFNAGAVGLPIISTRHCDIPSVVLDQKTGLLTAENDTDALAQAIQTYYEMDQRTYTKYALAASQHIYANFSLNKNSRELREKYVQALN